MSVANFVRNLLRPLETRVANMVKRAIVERVLDDQAVQLVQLTMLEDDVQDRVEHMQPYGLSFVVPAGSEGVALAVQGAGSNRVLLCPSKRGDRPKGVRPGEGGIYSLGAWRLFCDDAGNIYLNVSKDEADDAVALASVADARLDALESKLNSLIATYNGHSHSDSLGGPTSPPTVTETTLSPGSSTASSTIRAKAP